MYYYSYYKKIVFISQWFVPRNIRKWSFQSSKGCDELVFSFSCDNPGLLVTLEEIPYDPFTSSFAAENMSCSEQLDNRSQSDSELVRMDHKKIIDFHRREKRFKHKIIIISCQ